MTRRSSGSARRSAERAGGFAMVEVIVSMAVASFLVLSFTALNVQATKIARVNAVDFKASMYLREAIEAAQDLSQSDWAAFGASCTTASPCHPLPQSGMWTLSAGAETLEGVFTRSLVVESVQRDQLAFPNQIVQSGGMDDPNTKKVIAFVSFDDGLGSRTITLESYVYNLE